MGKPIPFGEWLPDRPSLGLAGAVTATNVLPKAHSYGTFPQLVPYATGVQGRCQGGIVAQDAAGNSYQYVGDASALYSLAGVSFTAVTALAGAYSVGAAEYWEFTNWGNTVLATNGVDTPQEISLGAAHFAALAGTPPTGKHLAVMRDFVVLGNVSDSASNVYRVRWSAFNNSHSWTADASTQADFQDLPSEGGPVYKVLGGEYGVVLQQKSIWRMLYVGSPLVFQFDRVHNQIGALVPQAAVRYQNMVYFLSQEGFYAFDGSQLRPIGRDKVDKFFLADLNVAQEARCHAVIDNTNQIVLWAYPSNDSGGNPDKLLCYSWAFDRWALITGIAVEMLMPSITSGVTLEGLDAYCGSNMDALTVSLDDSQWTGGQIVLGGFDALHRLNRFNGGPMAATVESGEMQFYPDQLAMVTAVRPDVIGLSATISIALVNRNNLTESASVGYALSQPNATGFVPLRCTARYFRVRLQTDAGTNFTHIMGVEADCTQAGSR